MLGMELRSVARTVQYTEPQTVAFLEGELQYVRNLFTSHERGRTRMVSLVDGKVKFRISETKTM